MQDSTFPYVNKILILFKTLQGATLFLWWRGHLSSRLTVSTNLTSLLGACFSKFWLLEVWIQVSLSPYCFFPLSFSPFFPTESRPLSVLIKVMPDTTADEPKASSEEQMKEIFTHAWEAVKRLTLQVSICTQYCFYFSRWSRFGLQFLSFHIICKV